MVLMNTISFYIKYQISILQVPLIEKTCLLYMHKQCSVTAQLISTQSLYFLNPKCKASLVAIFCGCTDRFLFDLVGNREDRFSLDAAQLMSVLLTLECIETF